MDGRSLIVEMRARREAQGLSRRALSLRLGYGEETVRHWEDGQNNPSFPALLAWCQALGVRLELVDAGR